MVSLENMLTNNICTKNFIFRNIYGYTHTYAYKNNQQKERP